jgi:hypothetical protein
MDDSRRIMLGGAAWLLGITGLHLGLNVSWVEVLNDYVPKERRKLNVAYIPVT